MQIDELSKEEREALTNFLLDKVEHYGIDDRRRELFLYRYGQCDGQFHTLEECAKRFDITRERARQIISHTLNRRKYCARHKNIRDFYSP